MKKMNVFNVIAIASLCTTVLHGAVPPAEPTAARMARERVEALKEARGGTLGDPASELIQKYLETAYRIPIKIINNDTGAKPRDFEVTFQDASTAGIVASARVNHKKRMLPVYRIVIDENAAQAVVNVPLIPVNVTINHVYYNHTDEGGYEEIKRKKVSFALSLQQLAAIESISINRNFAEIQDKNGMKYQKNFQVEASNLPSE